MLEVKQFVKAYEQGVKDGLVAGRMIIEKREREFLIKFLIKEGYSESDIQSILGERGKYIAVYGDSYA